MAPRDEAEDKAAKAAAADAFDQALRVERGGGDHRQRLFRPRQAREGERVRRAGEPGVAPVGGE